MKSEMWYFTFGAGQEYDGYYVIVRNCGFSAARQKMFAKYGTRWCGQYVQETFFGLGMNQSLELLEEM